MPINDQNQQNLLSSPLPSASNSLPSQSNSLPPPANQNMPAQSLEQNALAGGNKQQVSNFMNALNRVGAGANNSFMSSGQPAMPQVQQLINPNASMIGANTPGYYGSQNQGLIGNLPGQVNAGYGGYTESPAATTSNNTNYWTSPNGLTQAASILPGSAVNPQTSYPLELGVGTISPYTQQTTNVIPPTTQVQPLVAAPTATSTSTWTAPTSPTNYSAGAYNVYSDENLKKNIKPGTNDIHDFLNSIKAHNYEYKDSKDGVGRFDGPMAQELEKTDTGKQAVENTPHGKMVNYGRLGAVNLAAVSVVHREQKRLQNQINQLRKEIKGKK